MAKSTQSEQTLAAAGETLRRLYVYNGGFLTQKRVRRILALQGFDVRVGLPGPGDMVGVWGQSPTSPRGEAVAARRDADVLRVEDAFLRSVLPGREGDLPLGLHLDTHGVHFDPSQPSDLELILRREPLDDAVLLQRARSGIERLRAAHVSKYNAFPLDAQGPEPGYVLVIDQTFGDASVKASGADRNTFREMLFAAAAEFPGKQIVVKTHPETARGHREGYLKPEHLPKQAEFFSDPISPWALLDGAIAVYTVSSQMGFEAILAGHRPAVFGQPFYVGWGLSDDRKPVDRRQRSLTRAQLFAGAMLLYPSWYDPYRDRACTFEDVVDTLEAQAKAWRDDHAGWDALGMRLWKRGHMQAFFGKHGKLRFLKGLERAAGAERPLMVWAGKATAETDAAGAVRVEDGFLRSQGLGAELVPPVSLVLDDLGIYYDAGRESRFERLVNDTVLRADQRERARGLIRQLLDLGLTKYNMPGQSLPDLPKGRLVLVPGQVEDDASLRLGTTDVSTNAALLAAARAANPSAVIVYKPHPDVEAGLRPGAIEAEGAEVVLHQVGAVPAIEACDEVWTMTSTLGFEALLRGKPVTCLGHPFYAGWGLTDDRGVTLPRREALPDLETLVYCALIAYPRYFDPVSGLACPVEVAVDRLAAGGLPRKHRLLAKVQGVFASYAHLWRRP